MAILTMAVLTMAVLTMAVLTLAVLTILWLYLLWLYLLWRLQATLEHLQLGLVALHAVLLPLALLSQRERRRCQRACRIKRSGVGDLERPPTHTPSRPRFRQPSGEGSSEEGSPERAGGPRERRVAARAGASRVRARAQAERQLAAGLGRPAGRGGGRGAAGLGWRSAAGGGAL